MKFEDILRETEESRGRVQRLRQNSGFEDSSALLADAMTELELHMEELEVVNQELRDQRTAMQQIQGANEAYAYREVFDSLRTPVLVTNYAGVILEANTAAVELLNLPRQGRKPLATFVPPAERRAFRAHLARLQEHGQTISNWTLQLVRRNGHDDIKRVVAEVTPLTTFIRGERACKWTLQELSNDNYLEQQNAQLQKQLEATQQARDLALEREIKAREELNEFREHAEQRIGTLEEMYDRAQLAMEQLESVSRSGTQATTSGTSEPLFALLGDCEQVLEDLRECNADEMAELVAHLRDSARAVLESLGTGLGVPSPKPEQLQDEEQTTLRAELHAAQQKLQEQRRASDQLVGKFQQLEKRLEQRSAQLHSGSRELECIAKQFSRHATLLQSANARLAQTLQTNQVAQVAGGCLDELGWSLLNLHRAATAAVEFAQLGRATPKLAEVNVSKLFKAVWESQELDLPEGREVRVLVDPSPDTMADAEMMATVLRHLLCNALHATKFTPDAEVRLACRVSKGQCTWMIHDNGPGIPRDKVHLLFKPFQKFDRENGGSAMNGAAPASGAGMSADCAAQSLGMGLAICRKIIERHGGTMSATSGPKGTSVSFTLPV